MTKYVLNSGAIRNNHELAEKFFAEVVKDLGDTPRILICLFAQPREDWEQKFSQVTESNFFPKGVRPIFELAFPEKFEEQVRDADVVHISGGDDYLLQYWLRKYDLPALWEGKVVASSSAGSDALSASFWTCDWRVCMEGLGILPVKFLPHYESAYGNKDPRGPIDWSKALEELEKYGDTSLPIHALKEGEYVVSYEESRS